MTIKARMQKNMKNKRALLNAHSCRQRTWPIWAIAENDAKCIFTRIELKLNRNDKFHFTNAKTET